MVTRFEREVQLCSQLSHPNTIEIYDYGRTRAGQTAILVTHNDAEAHAMADRIGVMHAGRITHWLDTAK